MKKFFDAIHDNKYWQFLLLLLANSVIFALLAWMLPIRFEENDDVMMCMIASGKYSGTPDCHLVYINALYGCVLKFFYMLNRSIEWYTWAFTILHIFSISILAYTMWNIPKRSKYSKIVWLIFLYIFWARIIMGLQFTTTAGVVCAAGCMLLLRRGKWSVTTGVILVVIASLVRFQAAALVGMLFAPVIVYNIRWEWRRYVPIVIMLTLIVGCRVANTQFYKQPDWKYYREFNQIRAQLNDNPNAYRGSVLKHLPDGIQALDYKLMLAFYPDPQIITLDKVRQINQYVDSMPMKKKAENIKRLECYQWILMLLAALFIVLIVSHKSARMMLLLIGYMLFFAGLMVHVSLDGFLKERVFLCFMLPAILTIYLMIANEIKLRDLLFASCFVTALCVIEVADIHQRTRDDYYHRVVLWQHSQLPLFEWLKPDDYVVTLGTSMHMEFMNPYHISEFPVRKYILGWATHIPFNKPIANSFLDFTKDNIYLFVDGNVEKPNSTTNIVRHQIMQHYHQETTIVPICHNKRYAIIQLKKVEK